MAIAGLTVASRLDVGRHATAAPPPVPLARIAPLGFVLPAPGSYRLEHILDAPDGKVLDSDGNVHRLRDFTTGKITLFSFVYTYCSDAKGCPLTYVTLHAVAERAARDPAMQGKVRLVSMSFDPLFDTPAMMRSYGGDDAKAGRPVPWHFLTTAAHAELAPVLEGFGQDVAVVVQGRPGARVPVLRHLLKVYLLDQAGSVREIYAPAYLHPDVLYNDIRTVMMERSRANGRP